MNQSLAASRSPSHFVSPATIPFDFTSFITDHQQIWLPQSPSSAPARTSTVHNSFNQDFQLFGTAQETPPRPTQHSRAQATSSIGPNNLTQHFHPVSGALQVQTHSNGNIPTSHNNRSTFSPQTHQQNQQQHQRQQQARSRPPIPLFPQASDGAIFTPSQAAVLPRRIHSTSSISQGEYCTSDSLPARSLIDLGSTDMSNTFDTMFLPGDDYFSSAENMMNFGYSEAAFTAVNGAAQTQSPATPRTVSPQELMNHSMAMSAPSSTAFPPLNTPDSVYLESPYMGSSSLDTSPMIDGVLDSTLDYNTFATPLFPQDGSDIYSNPTGGVTASDSFVSNGTESTNVSGASPMVRQTSSPGRPYTSGSTHGHARKHSAAAGVKPTKARRPLDPILISEVDSREDAKRKKNTAAARKSRQKRQEGQERSEAEIQRLRDIIINLGGDPDAE